MILWLIWKAYYPEDSNNLLIGRIKFGKGAYITSRMVKWYGGITIISETQGIDARLKELLV